jgi:chemotaxis regulatin CheY-phosphate phosphatase CheZ
MPAESWPSAENAATATSPAAVGATPGAADYDAILAAVMETERGRWFLAEYARRNRHADTAEVLAALERLAARSGGRPFGSQADARREAGADDDRLRGELADLAAAIARTKTEIAAILPEPARGDRTVEASEPLDAVVRSTERATTEILAAAKQVQDVAWTMREQGMEQAFCDRLDRYATEICAACSSQDLTGQRTRKIVHVLRYIEARIQAMHGLWHAAVQSAPQAATEVTIEVTAQAAIEATPAAVAPAPEPAVESGDLAQSDADGATEPAMPVPVAAPAVTPPPITEVVEDNTQSGRTPSASADEEKPTTHTIEGPTGSFSILTGRTAEPEEAPAPAPAAAAPAVEPEAAIDDLRALAAQLVAEFGNDADAPDAEPYARAKAAPAPTSEIAPAAEAPRQAAPSLEPEPVVEPEPIIANLRAFAASFAAERRQEPDGPEAAPVVVPQTASVPAVPAEIAAATKTSLIAAPSPVAAEQSRMHTDEAALPLTAAPQLGDLPQRPAPEPQPSPRRKADIAENLFADVMALTEEERIALFT